MVILVVILRVVIITHSIMPFLRVVILTLSIMPFSEAEMSESTICIQALAVPDTVSTENWVVEITFGSLGTPVDFVVSCFNPPEAFLWM